MTARFLVASSNRSTLELIQKALQNNHPNVLVAVDGLEAVDLALDNPPDAIFLDVRLAGLSGIDVARSLRAITPTERVPIVFLAENQEEAKKASEAHIPLSECLVAPYDPAEIKKRVTAGTRPGEQALAAHAPKSENSWMLATLDPLTRLYHRRFLMHQLAYEAARGARYNTPLTVMLVDVDNLKEINRQHGILMGDTVLIETGQLLKKLTRTCDVVGRNDTQDFMIIVPQTNELGARVLASRICQAIAEHHFILEKLDLHITVSVGVASSESNDLSENLALLGRAEGALDRAKRSGKNRVEVG